jgi:hypothetical protein
MRTVLLLLPLAGCLRDLPDDLGTDALAAYRAFDQDPVALVDAVASLDRQMDPLDLDGRARDRLFDLPELTRDDLGGAAAPIGIDTDAQMRAAMVGRSTHTVDENLHAQVQVDQSCINARSVQCQERLPVEGSDAACFESGTCVTYRTTNRLRVDTPAADFWLEAPVDFARFELPDGRLAAVGRTWLERGFENDSGNRTWSQRFGLDVFVEDPDDPATTRRYYATWLGPDVNGLGGALLQDAVRHGIDEGFSRPDAWLDGETCRVELDHCLAAAPF